MAVAFTFAMSLKSVTLYCSQKFPKIYRKTPSNYFLDNLRFKEVLLCGNVTEKSFLAIEIARKIMSCSWDLKTRSEQTKFFSILEAPNSQQKVRKLNLFLNAKCSLSQKHLISTVALPTGKFRTTETLLNRASACYLHIYNKSFTSPSL